MRRRREDDIILEESRSRRQHIGCMTNPFEDNYKARSDKKEAVGEKEMKYIYTSPPCLHRTT
jgi:hypothetical protein